MGWPTTTRPRGAIPAYARWLATGFAAGRVAGARPRRGCDVN
jgi:hypothetical protein